MIAYTVKNLRETKDSAPEFGLDAIGEAHFPREELGAESTGLAYLVLKPGCRQAFGHRHEEAEEVYIVLAGDGRVRLDGETVAVAPLDAVRVAPSVTRGFEAGSEGLALLAFGPRHAGDGEIVEDFWSA